jgi:hypothetical protein
MPNLPIAQLPSASVLTGSDVFAVVQGGTTKQTTFNSIYTGLTGSFVTTSSFNTYTSSVQSYYLSAYHTASILLSNVGTTYSMSYSTTDFSSGISISGSDKSKIKIEHNGIYDIQFSAQFDKTNSSNAKNYIWLAKNGVNVPDSEPVTPTLPVELVEYDLIKDLDVSIDDIVILPAEDATPLCIDLIGDTVCGNTVDAISCTQ